MDLKTVDILMIIAVLAAPVAALQVQILLEKYRVYSGRQSEVYRMLMATRGTRLSSMHIEALNRIDIEFYGRRILWFRLQTANEKRVISAWRSYHNHLAETLPTGDTGAFFQKRYDLFIALLHKISIAAGYDFDETHLKEMSYTPVLYQDVEADHTAIRKGLVDLFNGEGTIPVEMIVSPEAAKRQEEVSKAFIAQSDTNRTLRVQIVKEE